MHVIYVTMPWSRFEMVGVIYTDESLSKKDLILYALDLKKRLKNQRTKGGILVQ